MAINRRNVLLGLGAIVGGGGALVGTGAFSSVSAAREVSVSTAGDASAYITMSGDGEYISDDASTSAELTIDLGTPGSNGFNKEAITDLTDVITVTNNSAETGETVKVGVSGAKPGASTPPSPSGSTTLLIQDADNNNVALVTFKMDGDEGQQTVQELANTETANIDITVNTRDEDMSSPPAGTTTANSLTIVAEEKTA